MRPTTLRLAGTSSDRAAVADEEKVLRIVALALAALTGAARGDAGDIVLARSSDFLKFLKGESQ